LFRDIKHAKREKLLQLKTKQENHLSQCGKKNTNNKMHKKTSKEIQIKARQ
jgi:hypothetical protein